MREEFEQLPNESAKAYKAFSLYLSLGRDRTTRTVAQQLDRCLRAMQILSKKYRWVERTAAYERHLAKIERDAQSAALKAKAEEWQRREEEHREEEWSLRGELIAAARKVLKRFTEEEKGATLGDVARALELASKLGRLSSGLAADKTEVTGEDGGPIRVEFEMMLKKIYSEPAVDVEAEPQKLLLNKEPRKEGEEEGR